MPPIQHRDPGPADLTVAFEPMVDVDTALPFAYRAALAGAEAAGFETRLAASTPEAARALDIARATLAIDRAVAGGLLETHALLALPVSIGHSDPAPVVAAIFRAAVARRVPAERLVVVVSADEYGTPGAAARLVESCAAQGLAFALEAFVMGAVGVRLLARFTPRFVTLDRALVRNLETGAARARIVEGVVRLTRRAGIALGAPGVQSATELAALHRLGIRYMQGGWIAAPDARIVQPDTASAPPLPRSERRHTLAVALRGELNAFHRRLRHHRRGAASGRDGAADLPSDLTALSA